MEKTVVIYETKDPNGAGITHIAIQTEALPPYVFSVYTERYAEDLPKLGSDMLLLPIEQAKRLFEFKKGSLADVVTISPSISNPEDLVKRLESGRSSEIQIRVPHDSQAAWNRPRGSYKSESEE